MEKDLNPRSEIDVNSFSSSAFYTHLRTEIYFSLSWEVLIWAAYWTINKLLKFSQLKYPIEKLFFK